MELWSNPNPSNQTAAALTAGTKIDAPSISGIVASILAEQYRKQQQYQDVLNRVGQAVGDYRNQQDAGALADYMQANAPYVNADNAAQLSNMSPAARLSALQWMQQRNDIEDKMTATQDQNDVLNQIHAMQVAGQIYKATHPSGTGGKTLTPGQVNTQNRFEEKQALADLKNQIADLNLSGGFKSQGGPITMGTLENPDAVHAGVGPGGEYVPDGYYAIGVPGPKEKGKYQTGFQTVVSAADFDKAHSALDAYKELQAKHQQQSQQQGQSQGVPPAGTKGIINGKPVIWDGHGWILQ